MAQLTGTQSFDVATPRGTTTRIIPIEHDTAVHEIETTTDDDIHPLTLMELVDAVGEVAENEEEVLATVSYMLKSGRVHLADNHAAANLAG